MKNFFFLFTIMIMLIGGCTSKVVILESPPTKINTSKLDKKSKNLQAKADSLQLLIDKIRGKNETK